MHKNNPYAKLVFELIRQAGLKPVAANFNEIYCFGQYEHEKVWLTLVPSAHEEKVKLQVQKLYSDRPDYEKIMHLDGLILSL